ncbi:MAG: MBL fold metallo-hydrolase [Candidatus Bathyarchaeia archaeon]
MSLRIKWESGVLIEHKDTKIILDPYSRSLNHRAALVTHAHLDHSHAFKVNHILKFSSEETGELVALDGISRMDRWRPIREGERIAIDDIEVTPHSSGHVLGSYEFEIITPEGTILFTGDLNTREHRTVRPAEPVQCDVLIIESTFGSPDFVFPPDETIAKDIVDWASKVLSAGKIPVFQADSLGNAQEVIRVFNENTTIPIVSHRRISRVNRVYEMHGYRMEYIDMEDERAHELISNRNAVIVAPKRLDLSFRTDYVSALVSGWALKFRRKSFPLSDHADFPNLMEFIGRCRPKIVLTYHGGRHNSILAKYVEKKLKIRAYPIDLIPTRFQSKISYF